MCVTSSLAWDVVCHKSSNPQKIRFAPNDLVRLAHEFTSTQFLTSESISSRLALDTITGDCAYHRQKYGDCVSNIIPKVNLWHEWHECRRQVSSAFARLEIKCKEIQCSELTPFALEYDPDLQREQVLD